MESRATESVRSAQPLSRREFLKLAALGLGGLAFARGSRFSSPTRAENLYSPDFDLTLADFPDSPRLGRACRGSLEIKAEPDPNSQTVGLIYEDGVAPWLREVVSKQPSLIFNNQRWVETDGGYVYGPLFQPVRNLPNQPVQSLPTTSSLGPGMWVEVTVPYVDVILENKPTSNSWVEALVEQGLPVRLYYSQIFWVDKMKTSSSGKVLYRVNPNYYGGVDMLWAPAEAFRPITADELAPINPDATDKRIVVDVTYQTLACYEGKTEVYYCRVSTGAKFDMYGNAVDKWATPVGPHRVARKYISLQMAGGTTGAGYDLPGIGWTSIFATGGVAIHSTFWHNNYGDPMSHGCVNVSPEDAKWIFLWTLPSVPADPGMMDISASRADSTKVDVIEG
jgi:lipoprotein-anchoring transpeptidase ErfK/SrfK